MIRRPHGGVVVRTAGDAFFVAFARAADAVAACDEAERAAIVGRRSGGHHLAVAFALACAE